MELLIVVLLGAVFVCAFVYLLIAGIISLLPISAGRKISQKTPHKKTGTFLKCLGIALGIVVIIFPVVLTNLV